jgi:hypothetical protein
MTTTTTTTSSTTVVSVIGAPYFFRDSMPAWVVIHHRQNASAESEIIGWRCAEDTDCLGESSWSKSILGRFPRSANGARPIAFHDHDTFLVERSEHRVQNNKCEIRDGRHNSLIPRTVQIVSSLRIPRSVKTTPPLPTARHQERTSD